MSRSKISVKSVSSRTKLAKPVIYEGATPAKYKARKNASVEEIGGLMESSAPVTWKSLLEKQMMYAMLFCTSCDMVEFFQVPRSI
jgi:hypothetical protein